MTVWISSVTSGVHMLPDLAVHTSGSPFLCEPTRTRILEWALDWLSILLSGFTVSKFVLNK